MLYRAYRHTARPNQFTRSHYGNVRVPRFSRNQSAISGKHYTRNVRRCMKLLSVLIKKNLIYLHADQFREDLLLPFLTLLSNITALTVILMFSNEKIRIIGSAMRNKWVRRVPSAGFGGVHWIDKYPKALSRWLIGFQAIL